MVTFDATIDVFEKNINLRHHLSLQGVLCVKLNYIIF